MKDRREPLAQALAAPREADEGEGGERLDGLRANLELIDRVELRQAADPATG